MTLIDDFQDGFPSQPDAFLSTMSELLMARGETPAVEFLTHGRVSVRCSDYDNWNGGTYTWALSILLAPRVYAQLQESARSHVQRTVGAAASELLHSFENHSIGAVLIAPSVEARPNWREESMHFLTGEGISNQGRVRSTNVATRTEDGLLFRSQPEIFLYRALKQSGITFAPLPVFLRGGEAYRRIEPDFVLFKDRVLLIVELDGDQVHRELPAEADKRLAIFKHEGAAIERIQTSECDSEAKAKACVTALVRLLDKMKGQR